MARLRTDFLIATLAFALSLGACAWLYGPFFDPGAVSRGIYDAVYYDALGKALLHGESFPAGRFAMRGYLYPLSAAALDALSPVAFYLAQTLAVAAGVFLLLRAERALAGRLVAAPLALLSVTLLLSPSIMMTEAVAFLLASAALLLFVTPARAPWGVPVLFAAALVKPAFLPVAVLAVPLALRRNRRSLAAATVAALLLAPQLTTTYLLTGSPTVSQAGQVNFQRRFYPAVVGTQELGSFVTENSDPAKAARARRPRLADQLTYVLAHPGATIRTWAWILWDQHLTEGSGFSRRDNDGARPGPQQALFAISRKLNLLFLAMLLPAAAGLGLFLRAAPPERWPAAALAPLLFASAPLVYYQADRIVFIGFLTLLPFAGLALRRLAGRLPVPGGRG